MYVVYWKSLFNEVEIIGQYRSQWRAKLVHWWHLGGSSFAWGVHIYYVPLMNIQILARRNWR